MIVVLILIGVVCCGATLVGFTATTSLPAFRPSVGGAGSRYAADPETVKSGLLRAVEVTHGMRTIDQSATTVLISTYPTPMHLYGSFGLFVRCRVEGDEAGGSVLIMDAAPKLGWAAGGVVRTLHETERLIRRSMQRVAGVTPTLDYSPVDLTPRFAGESARERQQPGAAEPQTAQVAPEVLDASSPGWYPDPRAEQAGALRWWDGTAWTGHTHDGS